jgi:hypothetical protein
MFHRINITMVTAALLLTTAAANGQTVAPKQSGSQAQAKPVLPKSEPLTEASLVKTMKDLGYNPQEKTGPKNARYWVIQVQTQDGWTFLIEVDAMRNTQGGLTGYYLTCVLTGQLDTANLPAARLVQILKGNARTVPCFFVLRGDNRLCLCLEVPFTGITSTAFQGDIQTLTNRVKEHRSAWENLQ